MKKSNRVFQLSLLSIALLGTGYFSSALAQKAPTDVGTVKITGEGDALGNGLLIDEDSVKTKSTVTKAMIDKERPTANAYQVLNLMPSVNASSYDATGLFGGNLRVRGFNSDQMGFTINGAPVNDSGNFAVFPMEYSDIENMCEVFITQGSVDSEAPHVGASGGNVGMVSCSPKDAFGGRFSGSLGDLNFKRSFLRLDTGLIGKEHPFKAFVSYSAAQVDKFKGLGGANRHHIDVGLDWKLTDSTVFTSNLFYNYAINNNFATLTKNEFAQNPSLDFSSSVPQHLASGNESTTANFGTSSAGAAPRAKLAYYGYSLNPFENYLFTSRLSSRIDDKLTLSAEPYFWYGYGTGSTQQTSLAESLTGLRGGIADINKNGNFTDTVGAYRSNVTETNRPGITFKANYDLDNQKILAGLWIEQARHRQQGLGTTVDNNGGISDLWLRNNLLSYNDGTLYQSRNWKTLSTAYSAFVQDTISLGRLDVIPSVRFSSIKRDFTNLASSGTGAGADYQVSRTYSKPLVSLGARYKIDDTLQAYGNISQNMRTPSNFVLSGWVTGGAYVNGALTGFTLTPNNSIQAETSVASEAGLRITEGDIKGSISLFQVNFKNRLAQGFNPDTATYIDYNVGDSTIKGLELQMGSKPVNGWSVFGSATYTQSKILNNFPATATSTLPTSGSMFPDTPEWMYGASVQYASGPYLASLTGKYTGKRYTTLVNDEFLDAYTVYDLNAGYRFENGTFFKSPTVRLNVSNLFNKNYLIANSGSGSNITTSTTASSSQGGGFPSYYVGAPRFVSMTFSTDF